MDIKKLNDLKIQIENLDKIHHVKIFKILKDNNIKFSENRNGIFINMATINIETLDIIEKTLIYIKEQEKQLKDIECIKADLENDFFNKNSKAVKDNNIKSYNASELS